MMQYFGVPRCPYCNKRVNIIRTWSLKKQGEYKCPRCGGISNIFLSPLIYVFAVIAIFTGGAIFFFHRFVMDDIVLTTAIQVLIPFGCFFFLSLFTVYLKKPVINKATKNGKKRRAEASPPAQGARRTPVAGERIPQRDVRSSQPSAAQPARQRMFNDDYTPAVAPPAAPRRPASPEARRNPPERQPIGNANSSAAVRRPNDERPVRREMPREAERTAGEAERGRRFTPEADASGRRFASQEARRPQNPEAQRPRRMPRRDMYDDEE